MDKHKTDFYHIVPVEDDLIQIVMFQTAKDDNGEIIDGSSRRLCRNVVPEVAQRFLDRLTGYGATVTPHIDCFRIWLSVWPSKGAHYVEPRLGRSK